MNMLMLAIITITFALIFYTVGIWGEKLSGTLKKWHLVFFWLGFACDTTGTFLMASIANAENVSGISIHNVTGTLAILLMLFHAVWATIVILKNDEKWKTSFHKFGILVWLIWLIPYLSGLIVGMTSH